MKMRRFEERKCPRPPADRVAHQPAAGTLPAAGAWQRWQSLHPAVVRYRPHSTDGWSAAYKDAVTAATAPRR
jgi:hypothetical protein